MIPLFPGNWNSFPHSALFPPISPSPHLPTLFPLSTQHFTLSTWLWG
uniref:Uncharacterized protein n=1 Tax=Desertifilum tharense IPPAS B-1220 TaxID=1781255 RepID=A0ACD5GX24_9CYAN